MPYRVASHSGLYRPTFIRRWRKYRGLSLDELAAQMSEVVSGISKSQLSRLERGLQPYSQPVLEGLAEILRCQPADLLMRDPHDEFLDLLHDLRVLDAARQRRAVKVLKALSEEDAA